MVVRFGFLRCGYGCGVWICDVAMVGLDLRCRGRERSENVRKVCWATLFFTHLGPGLFLFLFFFFFSLPKVWYFMRGGVRV